jgi:tetratricopeptide (TPR) repeat protein
MTRSREHAPAIFVALVLLAGSLHAQERYEYWSAAALWAFASALYDEGDYPRAAGEFLRFAFTVDDPARAVEARFRVAKCRQLSGDLEKALADFRTLAGGAATDPWTARAGYETAITLALLGRIDEALPVLADPLLPDLAPAYDPALIRSWCLLLGHDWTGAETAAAGSGSPFAPYLVSLAAEGRSLPRRSPAAAGVLSAILPGSGKLYAGRTADGLFSFGLVGTLVLLSGLRFADEGVRSVRGWVYGSFALLFHAGNIYGSVAAAREFNLEGERAIDERARGFHGHALR